MNWCELILESKINFNDALKIFNLSNRYSNQELKQKYKLLAKKHHPDLGGSSVEMYKINISYELLKEKLGSSNNSKNKFIFDQKGSINVSSFNLTSLKGAPQEVNGSFICENNNLTSLDGAPQKIGNSFNCSNNSKLTSLRNGPKFVNKDYYCNDCYLTSLDGAPKKISGIFSCQSNALTSLKGAPQEVGGFYCEYNSLESLDGMPKRINGDFDCSNQNSGKKFTEGYIRSICDVKGNIFL